MQSTSQPYRALLAAGAPLQARATIGGVVYTDISAPVITRALMQDRLSVGNVVSASLALAVRGAVNIPRSAAVVVEVRLNDGQTASEWLPQGTFYISRRMRDPVTGLLALECYDALLKANAVWTPSAGAWPRTMAAVTAELAALLGVTLDSRTVIPTGAAYAMSEPAEGTTIRDALGVVAQAAGGNWVMTSAGLLRLVRVGESGDTVDVTGVVGGIDVGQAGTVTGVRSTVDGVVTLIGDDTGIVVDVSIAPMIAAEMAEDLIGQAYAPFHLSGAIYDPAAELGDGVRAGAGGEVISALCSEQAAYGPAFRGDIAAPDPGEVTDEYPYIGSAERTLALAKAAAIEAVDRLDDELTQQEIFNRLTDDGAAQGLLLYNGQLYINASYINAGYLSADHIQGGTLTLGGRGNQNGVLLVLDASGNVITVLNNAGADITNGSLTTYSTDRQTRTVLSDGLLKFQFYNSAAQPIGWRDALRLAADSQSATIGTFAGIAELTISGRGRVKLKNNEGTTDPDYAEIDMDDDSISLTATKNLYGWTSLEVTKDGVTVTRYDHMGDPRVLFELAAGQSSKPLSIGNGGTGATTAADARTNLEITPANIGAVSTSDVINVAHGGTNATTPAQARANLEITPANIGAVAKSGDTMTGPLNVPSLNINGNWPTIWLYSNDSGTLQHVGAIQVSPTGQLSLLEYKNGSLSEYYRLPTPTSDNSTPFDILTTKSTVTISQGGTGATTAAVTITNNYSSVLNVINAVRGTRIFPISIQKKGSSSYSDMPSGHETAEWNLLLIGDEIRLSAMLYIFNRANNPIYVRQFYNDHWLFDWVQIN